MAHVDDDAIVINGMSSRLAHACGNTSCISILDDGIVVEEVMR